MTKSNNKQQQKLELTISFKSRTKTFRPGEASTLRAFICIWWGIHACSRSGFIVIIGVDYWNGCVHIRMMMLMITTPKPLPITGYHVRSVALACSTSLSADPEGWWHSFVLTGVKKETCAVYIFYKFRQLHCFNFIKLHKMYIDGSTCHYNPTNQQTDRRTNA